MINKSLLYRVQPSALLIAQAFNGGDMLAIAFDRQRCARQDRYTIHENRAPTALTIVARRFRTREIERLAERMGEGMGDLNFVGTIPNLQLVTLTINKKSDMPLLAGSMFFHHSNLLIEAIPFC
jgi:hypothetical protein